MSTTFIYTKHIVRLCTAFLASLFLLAACQNRPTWQEQYDLGMRYLTESNYEEAVLAFTAAIEIDPNHVDSYVYLIQAQLASGDIEGAEETRKRGYKTTHSELFQYVIDNYTTFLIYVRSLPFEKRATFIDYSKLSSEEQTLIRQSISMLQSEEYEALRELLFNSFLPWQICTEIDGYRIEIDIIRHLDEFAKYLWYREGEGQEHNTFCCIEIRPQNGTGYAYTYLGGIDRQTDMNGDYITDTPFMQETYQVGKCEDGQYNGDWMGKEYNEYITYSFSRDLSGWIPVENSTKGKSIRTGQIKDYTITVNTLRQELELASIWGISNTETIYENGRITSYKINGEETTYPSSMSDEYLIAHFDDVLIRLRYW